MKGLHIRINKNTHIGVVSFLKKKKYIMLLALIIYCFLSAGGDTADRDLLEGDRRKGTTPPKPGTQNIESFAVFFIFSPFFPGITVWWILNS